VSKPKRLIGSATLCEKLDCSRPTRDRYIREKLIPPGIRMPGGHVLWDEDEIDAAIERMLRELPRQRLLGMEGVAPDETDANAGARKKRGGGHTHKRCKAKLAAEGA
jgi:predicted DNA-binding transcriptional regulator AlpA